MYQTFIVGRIDRGLVASGTDNGSTGERPRFGQNRQTHRPTVQGAKMQALCKCTIESPKLPCQLELTPSTGNLIRWFLKIEPN